MNGISFEVLKAFKKCKSNIFQILLLWIIQFLWELLFTKEIVLIKNVDSMDYPE